MKKLIIIVSLLLSLVVAGVLYGTHDKSEKVETVKVDQEEMNPYPEQMPDVILDPMTGHALY